MTEPKAEAERTDALPREIERKYLLRELPPRALDGRRISMAQGYLPGTQIRERLRREVTDDEVVLRRTIKLGRGIERIELEEAIDEAFFEALWPLTQGRRVVKTRYVVVEGERAFEIDAFEDRELFVAEVELDSIHDVVELPDWLSPYVIREVTDEPGYVNANLAR